jgi:hypothetical protein
MSIMILQPLSGTQAHRVRRFKSGMSSYKKHVVA